MATATQNAEVLSQAESTHGSALFNKPTIYSAAQRLKQGLICLPTIFLRVLIMSQATNRETTPTRRVGGSYGSNKEFQNLYAQAVLKSDGSVEAWGNPQRGGDESRYNYYGGTNALQSEVISIHSNGESFAAIKKDGLVVSWGGYRSNYGGNQSSNNRNVNGLRSGVVDISSTFRAYAAIKEDGSVITWGDSSSGGNSNSVQAQLNSGVIDVYSNYKAFAALKKMDQLSHGASPSGAATAHL